MDPVAAPIRDLLDLFARELTQVKFGELDASALEAKANEVRSAAATMAAAQAVVDQAKATLDTEQEALAQLAQRAMSYARVYAEDDASLGERLDAIVLPRSSARANKRGGRGASESAMTGAMVASGMEGGGAAPSPPDSAPRPRRGRKPAEGSTALPFDESQAIAAEG